MTVIDTNVLEEQTEATRQHRKDKRITIRIYSEDLRRIRELAEEEGLPYQTYITSTLHKLATGRLIDKKYLLKD